MITRRSVFALPCLALAGETNNTITAVDGIKVGHHTLKERPTGCTAILCEAGAVAGVDVRGAAPGTRDTELLNPINTVQQIHGVMLSGGSAFGLETAGGAMRYLESKGIGFPIAGTRVPIVPAAILMDLRMGDSKYRPTPESGYQACVKASNKPVEEGNVGAGAGATIGKFFGHEFAMKAGIGSSAIRVGNTGIVVGAIAAVNAVGDIVDPRTGQIVAGARTADGKGFRNAMDAILNGYLVVLPQGANTTLAVVATNVALDKPQMSKIAQMAHDGMARAVNPIHTPADGDTVFALSTGTLKLANVSHGQIGAIAAEALSQAILRAARTASTVLGVPGLKDWKPAAK
ncbi:MAG: P1 family peptidase [Acidobacteria bacterium]|nr:P1 family peptidase [Acidobacteriota bacterium]